MCVCVCVLYIENEKKNIYKGIGKYLSINSTLISYFD